MKPWPEIEDDFRSEVFRRGADKIARDIPADRASVYRLLNGDTKNPSLPMRAGIERLLMKKQKNGAAKP